MNDMQQILLDDLFTREQAAAYLGVSVQALKKSRHLKGFLMSAKLRLYSRAELAHYKAEGVGPGIDHTPYHYDPAWIDQVKATYLTRAGVAELLGISMQSVKENKTLKRYEIHLLEAPSPYTILYRRTDIEAYKANRR